MVLRIRERRLTSQYLLQSSSFQFFPIHLPYLLPVRHKVTSKVNPRVPWYVQVKRQKADFIRNVLQMVNGSLRIYDCALIIFGHERSKCATLCPFV